MYRIHIFEIDEGKKKVFAQYSTYDTETCFAKFKTSVRKERKPKVLVKFTKDLPEYESAEDAVSALEQLTTTLESAKYSVIAGTPLQKDYWQVYVIELDNNPMKVYVGQSIYDPEIRLEQHRAGLNSSVKIRRANNPKLRPDLYKHLQKLDSKEAAMAAEAQLAEELREKGFTVYGGH